MIWFHQVVKAIDQPETAFMMLTGTYNHPRPGLHLPVIVIELFIDKPDGSQQVIELFTKTPATLRYEEPTEDEVLAKYQHKIHKFMEKIPKTPYEAVLQW